MNASLSSGSEALFFDVFGTLVDWRTSVARESEESCDRWATSSTGWPSPTPGAANTSPAWRKCAPAAALSAKLDVLHRRNLERLLPRFGLQNLSDEVLDDLTLVWHRLDAWPDVPAALARLQAQVPARAGVERQYLADGRSRPPQSFSVGRHPRRRGRRVTSSRSRRVYLAACAALRSHAGRMHDGGRARDDLAAAAKCGLRTAHTARPDEYGPSTGEPAPTVPVDFAAKDLADLADKLGV